MNREFQKKLVNNWAETGRLIEELQIEEIKQNGPCKAIRSLRDVNRVAIQMHPPVPTSGVIEMQRLFSNYRKK